MLKQRILTASVLAALVVAVVIYLPTYMLAWVFSVMICMAAWEWCACIGIEEYVYRAIYVAVVLLGSMACWYLLDDAWFFWVVVGGSVWWHVAILLIICYQRNASIHLSSMPLKALIGVLVLVPCWFSLLLIHDNIFGTERLLFLFLLIWLGDSAAYFAGKKFGRKCLARNISPGKSWEGVYAALLMSFVCGCGYVVYADLQFVEATFFVLMAVLIMIFSIFGDLLESVFKRMSGIKDSGYILPGHGGVLDRIDSLTAAAPLFCVGLWLMDASL